MPRILEMGDIYFFYEPKREVTHVRGRDGVSRLYLVLSGDQRYGRHCRLLALDSPVLPQARLEEAERAVRARVEAASNRPEDMEAALAARRVDGGPPTPQHPRSVQRPAGEGRYALVEHDGHTDLDYVLELPPTPGPVQRELGILPQASYHLSLYATGQPSAVLDVAALKEGTDLLLEAESTEVPDEVHDQLRVEPEAAGTAEIFAELKLPKTEYPLEPLLRGEWR